MNKSNTRKKNAQKGEYNSGYKSKNGQQDQNQENAERIVLPSNWSKYEISENKEDENSESKNFNLLLSEPTSNYSFFKFKSEHNWDNDMSFVEFSNYFLLDLKLLSEGTICVPFCQRQDLNSFPFAGINDSNKKFQNYDDPAVVTGIFDNENCTTFTDIKETLVQNIDLCEETEESKTTKINILSEVEDNSERIATSNDEDNSESFKDDINELLNLKVPEHASNTFDSNIKAEDPLTLSAVTKTAITTTSLNLEQWLDDILDA
ncbi:hypothetical protein CBL_01780 [Carabus blaptoides fortunei]